MKRTIIVAVSLACIILAGVRMCRMREVPLAEAMNDMDRSLGRAVGRLVAANVKGGKVLVVQLPPALLDPVRVAKQMEYFRAAAAKSGAEIVDAAIDISGTADELAAERARLEAGATHGITLRDLETTLSRHPGVTLIALFAGEPEIPSDQLAAAAAKLPPMVCVCRTGLTLPELMKSGLVKAAIAPRRSHAPMSMKNDWFKALYLEVTPANLDEWWAGK